MTDESYTLDDAEQAVRDSMAADDRQTGREHLAGCKGLQFILDALAAAERELEGVRKVERALLVFARHRALYPGDQYDGVTGFTIMHDGDVVAKTTENSLAALGHALPDDAPRDATEGR